MAQSRDPLVEGLMRYFQNQFWIVKRESFKLLLGQLATVNSLCVRDERIAEFGVVAHVYVLDHD